MSQVSFLRGDIFERGADLTVLPCSAKGHISRSAERHVRAYELTLPSDKKLGEMEVHRFPKGGSITRLYAWAASVMEYRSDAIIIRSIGQKLAAYANEHPVVQVIETPLLGTGAGKLDPLVSGLALREGFFETSATDAVLNIYGQIATVIDQLRSLNRSRLPTAPPAEGQRGASYDVALSYAGENRSYVEQVAKGLRERGTAVFYDRFEEASLWGRDLLELLGQIFAERARYVLLFISEPYVSKAWPRLERQHALASRISRQDGRILPVRFDDTPLPGLPSSIAYVRADAKSPDELAEMVVGRRGCPVDC